MLVTSDGLSSAAGCGCGTAGRVATGGGLGAKRDSMRARRCSIAASRLSSSSGIIGHLPLECRPPSYDKRGGSEMLKTTIAGSLPKPAWLAEPRKLWPAWRPAGEELEQAKRDATLLWLKAQEDAGLDIVTDGEQSRQHFVHGL